MNLKTETVPFNNTTNNKSSSSSSSSLLQIIIQPVQSSYFAGERFQSSISICSSSKPVENLNFNSHLSSTTSSNHPIRHLSIHHPTSHPKPTTPTISSFFRSQPTDPSSQPQSQSKKFHNLDLSVPSDLPTESSSYQFRVSAPPHQTSFNSSTRRNNLQSTLLNWTYAQFEGYFEILDDQSIDPITFESLLNLRPNGGGRLFHEPEESIISPTSGNSWVSWLFNDQNHTRPSVSSPSLSSSRNNSYYSQRRRRFPIFKNPISLLDLNIQLQPDDLTSYSFSLDLPINLPPTFKGKSIRIGYEMIVGTNLISNINQPNQQHHHQEKNNRQSLSAGLLPFQFPTGIFGSNSQLGSTDQNSKNCQIFRVPIRVFNNVNFSEVKKSYDLMKPIISPRDVAKTIKLDSGPNGNVPPNLRPSLSTSPRLSSFEKSFSGCDRLKAYALGLMSGSGEVDFEVDEYLDGGGCKTAIEIVTRSSPKVTFEINRKGKSVGRLTLTKSSYRLGDMIEGCVEMNNQTEQNVGGKIIKINITLESKETVTNRSFSKSTNGVNSSISGFFSSSSCDDEKNEKRKIYSEQEELVIDKNRIGFSILIPNDESPEFEIDQIRFSWSLRLKLMIIPNDPEPTNDDDGSNNNNNNNISKGKRSSRLSDFKRLHHRVGSSTVLGQISKMTIGDGKRDSKRLPKVKHQRSISSIALNQRDPRGNAPRKGNFGDEHQKVSKRPKNPIQYQHLMIHQEENQKPYDSSRAKRDDGDGDEIYRSIPEFGYVPKLFEYLETSRVILVPIVNKIETLDVLELPVKVYPSNTLGKAKIFRFDI